MNPKIEAALHRYRASVSAATHARNIKTTLNWLLSVARQSMIDDKHEVSAVMPTGTGGFMCVTDPACGATFRLTIEVVS